jgi:hypothetical protein
MPSPYKENRKRNRVFVTINGYDGKYGFITNHNQFGRNKFGHKLVDNTTNNVVFGANLPEPPRATYRAVGGTYSSYFDWGKYETLRAEAETRLSPGRYPIPEKTYNNSKLVYVQLNQNIKYAWYMPNWCYQRITDKQALGLKDAAAGDALWLGINNPKPKTAKNKDTGVTTFIAYNAQLNENWSQGGNASSVKQFEAPF